MIINFSEQLAIDFDLEVEYFLRNMVSWIRFNASKDNPEQRNFQEGQYWSYNSYPEYAKLIPVFSQKQIRTVSARAIKHGLLQIGHFNKKKYDNTNWYTLTPKAWAYFEREAQKLYPDWFVDSNSAGTELNTPAQMGRPPAQMGRPIPKELNSLSNIINITTSDNSKISCEQVRDVYHEVLPDSPRIRVIGNELKKQIKSMIRNWPQYNKDKKPFTLKSFADFLSFIHRNYGWFLKPYKNPDGKKKHNNLTNITREKNIVRIINGEFSAS